MQSPVSIKRVRFSPDVKDADDLPSSRSSSPVVHPKTPRRHPLYHDSIFPPSPPLSDTSSLASESDVFLHQLLLPNPAGLNVVFDVRGKVSHAYAATLPAPTPLGPQLTMMATHPAMRRIRLVSRHSPWTITVENPNGVTFGDILYRMHESLHKSVSKQEFESVDAATQTEVLKAYQRNCVGSRKREDGLKRVDWLGKRVLFAGIQKDDRYLAKRVADPSVRAETFVLEFAFASA